MSNTAPARGFTIRIYLADGDPAGMRIIEKSNWTGKGLMFPRSRFAAARSRPESNRTGVYLLFGRSEETGADRLYIGEGDPVRPRLDNHGQKKDFWTHAYVFVSKDDNLNKAHVQYLEARLVQLAREAKRCEMDNANRPEKPSLSEADAAEAESFLEELMMCLPVLGLTAFERAPARTPERHILRLRSKGLESKGYESSDGFVVLAGSMASPTEAPTIHRYMTGIRQDLLKRGVLVDKSIAWELVQDFEFDSPSTAAGVMLGRTANGRVEWKDEAGTTLKELQERRDAGAT